MNVIRESIDQPASDVATTLRNAGIAGAGGAGFPAYAKWERVDEVDYLLVNHQESEPNYFVDKWLGRERAEEFAELFDALLDRFFDVVVVAAKETDRDDWVAPLEEATGATVRGSDELPLDPAEESGIVVAYTDDKYEYGMESVLLRIVGDTVIGDDLPMDHGWLVQNTETMWNVRRALTEGEPVTDTLVHVDGEVPEHRFLEVPIGTRAPDLLEAAGVDPDDFDETAVLADGGPGWCFDADCAPEEFGVRKRTNCVLVLDEETVRDNTLGGDRINVLAERDWHEREWETEPTERLDPDAVRVPLITNPSFEGVVAPAAPVVRPGDSVEAGELIAVPSADGVSVAHHAPIDGRVTDVSDTEVSIAADTSPLSSHAAAEVGTGIGYWTMCIECGSYVIPPFDDPTVDLKAYVCENCS